MLLPFFALRHEQNLLVHRALGLYTSYQSHTPSSDAVDDHALQAVAFWQHRIGRELSFVKDVKRIACKLLVEQKQISAMRLDDVGRFDDPSSGVIHIDACPVFEAYIFTERLVRMPEEKAEPLHVADLMLHRNAQIPLHQFSG